MKQPLVRRILMGAAAPAIAFGVAFVVSSIVLLVSGSDPIQTYDEMLSNGLKLETMIDTLNRATPLYISGVAAAIGFRMNLFNIGVEGQYVLAAFLAAVIGARVELPGVLHIAFIILVAMVVGSAWAGLAGLLNVTRGVNEVISTIMLNAIAIGGVIAAIFPEVIFDPAAANQGTEPLPEAAHLGDLNWFVEIFTRDIGKGRELTGMIVIAIVIGAAYHVFLNRTRLGFDLRASGINPFAARVGGVPPKRMVMIAMLLSGAVAGLVGMPEILSVSHAYDQSFVRGLGFAGIAVSLLGRTHPIGIALAAILFGFLDSSAGVLQISGSASREIVVIMQATILLAAVIAYEVVNRIRLRQEVKEAAAMAGVTQ